MTLPDFLFALFCALFAAAIAVTMVIKGDYEKVERGED